MGLNDRIESLPSEMQVEVADFVEHLRQKRARQQAETAVKSISAVKRLKGLGKEIRQETDTEK